MATARARIGPPPTRTSAAGGADKPGETADQARRSTADRISSRRGSGDVKRCDRVPSPRRRSGAASNGAPSAATPMRGVLRVDLAAGPRRQPRDAAARRRGRSAAERARAQLVAGRRGECRGAARCGPPRRRRRRRRSCGCRRSAGRRRPPRARPRRRARTPREGRRRRRPRRRRGGRPGPGSRRSAPPRRAARRARAARLRAGRCRRRAARPRGADGPACANASIRPPTFLSGTSRPTVSTRTGRRRSRGAGDGGADRLGVERLEADLDGLRARRRARAGAPAAALLAAMNPCARPASQRWSRSCGRGSASAIHGVSSLKITSGMPRRRHHAHVRSAAGPYSQTTTTSGPKLRSARSSPRGQTTGVRPCALALHGPAGGRRRTRAAAGTSSAPGSSRPTRPSGRSRAAPARGSSASARNSGSRYGTGAGGTTAQRRPAIARKRRAARLPRWPPCESRSWPSGTRRRRIRCSGSGPTGRRWRPAMPAPRCACWRCAGRSRRCRRRAPGCRRCAAWARGVRGCSRAGSSTGSRSSRCRSSLPRGRGRTAAGAGGWRRRSRARSRGCSEWPFDVVHAHSILPPGHAVHLTRRRAARVVSTHGPDIIHVARGEPVGAAGDRGDAARRRPRPGQLRLGRAPLPRAGGRADRHRGRPPGCRPAGAAERPAAPGRRS